jgi:hypothetical protein
LLSRYDGGVAWRIHDNVLRGEIDNREKGVVRGRIWMAGVAEPLVLELAGNAAPDLAGCLLTFSNPGESFPLPKDRLLNPLQQGTIGDLTASRKVRVWDVPFDEGYQLSNAGMPVPEHTANSIYLEWFSDANGRVVIESTCYKVEISPPAWRLSKAEEEQRQQDAAQGFSRFMGRLNAALEAARHEPPPDKEWDEFDHEKLLRESDARTNKYAELLDKYQDDPNCDEIIDREMGWTKESAQGAEGEEEDEPFAIQVPDDFPEPEPDPSTEGVDWVRDEDGRIAHPLSLRAFNAAVNLFHHFKKLGLDREENPDLQNFLDEFRITGAKLAGALNSLGYGRHITDGAFTVACLKRALNHLHATQAALEKSVSLLPAEMVKENRQELFQIRERILKLMEEFRKM